MDSGLLQPIPQAGIYTFRLEADPAILPVYDEQLLAHVRRVLYGQGRFVTRLKFVVLRRRASRRW